MSNAERVCKALIATGRWTKISCELCHKVNKSGCMLLIEQLNKEQLTKKEVKFE